MRKKILLSMLAAFMLSGLAMAQPVVNVTSPGNNQNHKAGVNLLLAATAVPDSGRTITKVEFFDTNTTQLLAAGILRDTILWSVIWAAVPEGTYTIIARAIDSENDTTVSAGKNLIVTNIPDDVWADSIPNDSLIISEVMMGDNPRQGKAYVEFTNTSSKPIDLSRYYIHNPNQNKPWTAGQAGYEGRLKKRLHGIVLPGQSWIITKRGVNSALDGYGNAIWPLGTNNWELESKADMIMNQIFIEDPGAFTIAYNVALTYVQLNGDSTRVDVFGAARLDPRTTNNNPHSNNKSEVTVAGKTGNDPIREYVFVRKFEVKKGNPLFDPQRGTDIIDSEWIPLPRTMDSEYERAFTTIGTHGSSTDLTLASDIATIDMDAKTITLPYGISRDSVFRAFEIGPNTAWDFVTGSDTSQFFVQTADTMRFYVAGTGPAAEYIFHVNVLPQSEDFAKIRPLIYKNAAENWVKNYTISDGLVTDTIGSIPFHEPIDTFVKYMAMGAAGTTAEGLAWKIKPASGIASPEIEYGDILEVTASNGSKKEYLLATESYFPSHNADLSLIVIPGLDLFYNTETFLPTDTMLDFATNNLQYVVNLPAGSKSSPAIIAKAAHNRSVVEVKRARNLGGSAEDQTATIRVTAEDDTTFREYKILFKVERAAPSVKGTPFISDLARGWGRYYKENFQLFNPTDEFVDLSEYVLIVLSGEDQYETLINNCATDQSWANQNSNIIRPGYKVMQQPDGNTVFQTDMVQDVVILEPKGVYSVANFQAFPMQNGAYNDFPKVWDNIGYKLSLWTQGNSTLASGIIYWNKYIETTGADPDPYETGSLLGSGFSFDPTDGNSLILAKIVNDSIKDGQKSVATSIEQVKADYEIVDVFNGETGSADWSQYDNDTIFSWTPFVSLTSYSFTRKPGIYKGNPVDRMSFGLGDSTHTVLPSEWNVLNSSDDKEMVRADAFVKFGAHLFLSNAHIPYLTSSSYLMGDGIVGTQNVFGVGAGTSATAFLGTMIKPDPDMTIKLFNADNTPKDLDSDIAEGDKMWSISANGLDSVLYMVKRIGALSDDCSLASSTYTVTKDGKTGKISGIELGTTIKDILATLTPADEASMIQTNGGEVVIPLMQFDNDTVKIQAGEMVDTKASEMVYIEVVAQNKVDTCLYALEFNEVNIPFLLSDVYVVDEASKVINFVTRVTPEKFLSNLIVSPGATATVMNKADLQRKTGLMTYDDRVHVKKGNVLVTYFIKYTIELGEGAGIENALEEAASESISAYPNPTSGVVTLNGFNAISKITVRDITGKVIQNSASDLNKPMVDLRNKPTGFYIITVNSSVGVTTLKVMKE